jgi:hypothetical protein
VSKTVDSVTPADRGTLHQAILSKYVDDHEALHRLFNEVQESLDDPKKIGHASDLLTALASAIAAHFRQEEVEGIFDQIEVDAPQLARELRQMRADHLELLDEADDLAAASVRPEQPSSTRQLSILFKRFRERMQRHESEENWLVQRAYCDDVGTKD